MLSNRMEWAVARTRVSGGVPVHKGTGMSTFVAVAGIAARKQAALDARYGTQGDLSAWSPPV